MNGVGGGSRTVVGIDMGGTTTTLGLVDGEGTLLWSCEIPTRSEEPFERYMGRVVELIDSRRTLHHLAAIGIGAPNANPRLGTLERPPNLAWGDRVDLVRAFSDRFSLPVVLANDADAAAVGELCYGGGRGMTDIIVITIGTGLGSGIVTGGRLLRGASGCAGELGHTVVDPLGRICACGKRGCLEAYVSAAGICRTARELSLERGITPPATLDPKSLADRASGGDEVARSAFEISGRILGIKLADAVAHTSPEAIFITGGISRAGDLILGPARRAFDEFLFHSYRGTVRIEPSRIPPGTGAVLGAAALAWDACSEFPRFT